MKAPFPGAFPVLLVANEAAILVVQFGVECPARPSTSPYSLIPRPGNAPLVPAVYLTFEGICQLGIERLAQQTMANRRHVLKSCENTGYPGDMSLSR